MGSPHIALVTGASRGIGRAIALRLASAGMKVLCTARTVEPRDGRYAGSLQETVDEIGRAGGHAVAAACDLAMPDLDTQPLYRLAEEEFGDHVDVVVHNAAHDRQFDITFDRMTEALFLDTVRVNVWAGWTLACRAIPGMLERGAGWILNVSSRAASPKLGPPYVSVPPVYGQCLYGSSKAMLDRLTTGAASELWESNIAVNALAPEGAIATENAMAVANVSPDMAEPEETMAEAALALCTGTPKILTGNVAYSLSLVVALGLPVHTLDGRSLVPGWQPGDIPSDRLAPPYLVGAGRLGRGE